LNNHPINGHPEGKVVDKNLKIDGANILSEHIEKK
jgi:hypothetical protein